MRRFNHKIFGTTKGVLKHYQLTPLWFYETSPGETWSGSAEHYCVTGATSNFLLNRFFHDVYIFNVPYRLVWPEWPNFVSQRQTGDSLTIPIAPPEITLANANDRVDDIERFFVKQMLYPSTSVYGINALPFYVYNTIWNRFFRHNDQGEVSLSQTTVLTVTQKALNYFTRLMQDRMDDETLLDTTNVDAARQSFAQDRFNKVRSMYGDKYTDYLRSLGVQASWSVLEDPEVVGKSRSRYSFMVTANTAIGDLQADDELGRKGGYWRSASEMKLRRTFTSEHGLIMALGVSRMESPPSTYSHPAFMKTDQAEYYSPEFAMATRQDDSKRYSSIYQANQVGAIAPALPMDVEKYLDLKTGFNLTDTAVGVPTGGTADDFYFTREDIGAGVTYEQAKGRVLTPDESEYANAFSTEVEKFGTFTTHQKLRKQSPVPKGMGTNIR